MTPPMDRTAPDDGDEPASRSRWASALHPVLFAAYPVLFLWSQNVAEADPADVLVPLLVTMGAAAIVTVLLGLLLRDVRRAAVAVTPIVIGLLMYGHAARVGRSLHAPVLLQQVAWLTLIAVGVIVAVRLSAPRIQRLGTGLTRVAAILIVITLVLIVPAQLGRGSGADAAVDEAAMATTTTAPRRDVYRFIFDRYGSDRSLELQYGLDNDLTPWLGERGFRVLGSYANYVKTSLSLSTTMQMTHLADMPGVPGPDEKSHAFLYSQIRSSAVAKQFKALGYRYINIGSWWTPTRSSPLADENLHTPGPDEFASSLIEASALPAILRRAGVVVDARERHWENNQFGLDAALGVRDDPGPKFVFAHILLPHDPYVFRADGTPIPEPEAKATPEAELYRNHLAFANSQIKDIVGYLLSGPEAKRPIVIIEGDEGPLACQSVDCVQTNANYLRIRLGNLLAMYLPGVDEQLPETFSSVNTFRTVFRDYFGADLPPLPDRSFTWPDNDHIYDFEDITDELNGP